MKKTINQKELYEFINDKKNKTYKKINLLLEYNNKINMPEIAKLLGISKMAVYKNIKKHNIKYNKKSKERNVKIFKIEKEYKTYIIKDYNTKFYKIGKSINPKYREKTLQSEKPSIKIIKVFDKNIENELHLKYNKNRIRGEWFNLNEIQIKYICTHY